MKVMTVKFRSKGTNHNIDVLLPETLAELRELKQEDEIVRGAQRALILEAKQAATGRNRRIRRYVRVDLTDSRLIHMSSLLSQCALKASRAARTPDQLEGRTTAPNPPEALIKIKV